METAIGTFQVDKDAAFTPKLGEVRTIDIFSSERRKIREKTVTDLVEDLARDRRFLHPIAVRDEGATGYRLIAGHHRLEAWKAPVRGAAADRGCYLSIAHARRADHRPRDRGESASQGPDRRRAPGRVAPLRRGAQGAGAREPGNVSLGLRPGTQKWDSESQFTAGARRPR